MCSMAGHSQLGKQWQNTHMKQSKVTFRPAEDDDVMIYTDT